jgi:hypothetical protein
MQNKGTRRICLGILYIAIGSWVFSIPAMPFVNISPQTLFPILSLFFVGLLPDGRSAIKKSRLLFIWATGVVIGVLIELLFNSGGSGAKIVKPLSGALFVLAVNVYREKKLVSDQNILNFVGLCCVTSVLWFDLEMTLQQPFQLLREKIYQKIYFADESSNIVYANLRTGLTPFTHMLGYQIAFAIPICISTIVNRRNAALGLVGILICILGLHLSGQRSALLASLLGSTAVVRRFPISRYGIVFASALSAVAASFGIASLVSQNFFSNILTIGQLPVLEKTIDSESLQDGLFRLKLQLRALELIALHPFGTIAHQVDWQLDGMVHVLNSMPEISVSVFEKDGQFTEIAVHNGYLVNGLKYGVFYLGIVCFVLWSTTNNLVHCCANSKMFQWDTNHSKFSVFISVCLVQSLFHNGSFMSFEPISLLVLSMCLPLELTVRSLARTENRAKQGNPARQILSRENHIPS